MEYYAKTGSQKGVDLGACPIFSITFVPFSLPALAVSSGSFSQSLEEIIFKQFLLPLVQRISQCFSQVYFCSAPSHYLLLHILKICLRSIHL